MSDSDAPSAIDSLVEEVLDARAEPDSRPVDGEATASEESNAKSVEDANTEPTMTLGYAGESDSSDGDVEEEAELSEVEQLAAERDSYLADSQRLAADFANFRKQSEKRVSDAAAAQSASLVRNLLPVLDACDSALEQDPDSPVAPIRVQLLAELEKSGLNIVVPAAEDAFDPELHDAVMHEPAEDGSTGHPVISEVLRSGYSWQGRIVRPAMVRVVG